MKQGLLFYRRTPDEPLRETILAAVARYQVKFGESANTAYVNDRDLKAAGEIVVPGCAVVGKDTCMQHHAWVGIEERNPSC